MVKSPENGCHIKLESLPKFVVEVPQHIWMRFHSISVCKVILEFRLESKLNKNDFLVVGGGGEGGGWWVMGGQAYPPSILPSLHPKYS